MYQEARHHKFVRFAPFQSLPPSPPPLPLLEPSMKNLLRKNILRPPHFHFQRDDKRRGKLLRASRSTQTTFIWYIINGQRNMLDCSGRRKIRLIEGNAKCRHLKKLTCKGSEAQNPVPPPPLTHCIRMYGYAPYTYSLREGGGRGESWTREKVRGATVHKAGSKIPTWIDCISSL